MFVFLIHDNELLGLALEKVAKKRGEPFYRMPSLAESLFLIQDLSPDVVVMASSAAPPDFDWPQALRDCPRLSEIPLVGLGSGPRVEGARYAGVIPLPIDPINFHRQIAGLIGQT